MAGGTVGGAENIFLEDILALSGSSELVQAVVTRNVSHRVKKLREKKIPVYTAAFSKWWLWPTRRVIKKAIRKFKPDIVQYWMGRAGSYAVEGSHVNVAWYGGYYNRTKRFASCTHHIVLTKDLQRHVIDSGADAEDVSIIHTMASFEKNVIHIARSELDTPEDAVVLLGLARLHWKKGFDVLLNALVELPQCVAWIAGDGPLRCELEELADELDVKNRVRFLGWRNDRERLLAACDIVAFPSRYEPFGTVMVDAWAMKKPLVAADAKGPAAYVQNGVDGILVPKDDVAAFAGAVKKIIDDPALRNKIVAGGWHKYQSTFTPKAFVQDSLELYKKLVRN
ncbi:MAG: glycosyltransferase family 1 protein [Alphaproteobacteria bacterium]|nr:glycosyltransferase family 1 protein [Alphaproteobacteria bacterium]